MAQTKAHVDRRKKHRQERAGVTASAGSRAEISPYVYYSALALVIVFFAALRVRLLSVPLERDEGEYAYGGQLLLQGASLYRHAYTMKLPGTHAAYAAILAVFGQTQTGVHLGLLLVNAATIVLVFLLCAKLFGRLAGLIAAASYGLLSTCPSVLGFQAHATHFVVLFAVAGAWQLLGALESNKSWRFFFSGLLLGFALLMKQPGIFFLLWAVLYVVWHQWKVRAHWKITIARLGIMVAAGALPLLVTCLLVWRSGTFHTFWFWTFSYAHAYGTTVPLRAVPLQIWRTATSVIRPSIGVWAIAAVGLTAFLWSARARAHASLVISFLLFSFFSVCPGFYFRPHYYILLLPAVAILAGAAVACATDKLQQRKGARACAVVPVLGFALACFLSLYGRRVFLFQLSPLQACAALYEPNPFPEALIISDYIRDHVAPGSTIAVLGSEPEIFFYSQHHSATGYIYAYPLLEAQPYSTAMQEEMAAEIESSHPEMVVVVNVSQSWVTPPNKVANHDVLDRLQDYVQQYYTVVGAAEMGYSTRYYWGDEAKEPPQASPHNLLVLKRNSPEE
jgi:uncharacterized membrane protein